MPSPLPAVEVLRKTIDDTFDPQTPVLMLRWADHGPVAERIWELPGGLTIHGGPPRRFGLSVHRHSADAFEVRLVWDYTQMTWPVASRLELLSCCLLRVLGALGLDLWSMLEQPLLHLPMRPRAA